EPNLDFELARYARMHGEQVRFNREARAHFLRFATSPDAAWTGNFRDLGASIMRMATLSEAGRITPAVVDEEIGRLRRSWTGRGAEAHAEEIDFVALLGNDGADALDRFDRVQLAEVVRVCRESKSLSEAGRTLFQASRERRGSVNDSDRLRKYLARFGLEFAAIRSATA
ncbi:MAG TPA: sigma 54-dependent transcriptional regulator, partial [Xanthomonadales bacterium]|nr:sigma 54-dependent transcriptional regulator [Xanthomonadales bacterium]